MPDYSACQNTDCPIRYDCARYLMAHGRWQSVSWFDHDDCSAFWPAGSRPPFALLGPEAADRQAECAFDEDTLRVLDGGSE